MLKFNKLSHIFYLKDSLSKLLLFAILLINYPAYSQFYDTGSEPTSVKWKQINTNNFQIIFDEEFYSEANRIANILEYSYNSVSEGLNNKPKKVSVIIHNNTVKSNGYVSWAPKRIEMYATPSQEMYPQDWLEQLCVHELRHVVQIDKLNQGITKILSIVFGQQATGVITGFLPLWYLEGDAVFTETVLTKSGRGRLPSFEKELRTILLCDEEQFSIYKTMFGSYKNFVPTYYKYGYNLRSYAQKRYGDSISNNVENFVAKHPFTIFPFHFAIKKYTAGNIKNLYNDTYEYLDSTWKSEDIKSTNYQLFSDIKDKDYENYSDPQFVDNNKIIALKSGLSHLKQIVLIDSSKQSILHEPGILSSQDLSYENNKVVWAEKRRDVRWENREYSELQILDINSKQIRQITSKSRYFAPDLSEKANKIVCIESDKKNNCYLTFLSTFNGKEYAKIKSPEGVFLQNPEWSTDNNFVYVIAVNKNGKGILRYNLEKKIWENILPFSYDDIQNIRITGDNLYYHSSYSGIDNIYLYKINTSENYKITQSKYGIEDFDINENSDALLLSEHSSQGEKIVQAEINSNNFEDKNITNTRKLVFEELIDATKTKTSPINYDSIDYKQYKIKSFRRWQHLFNFHSWLPFYFDYEDYSTDMSMYNTTDISNDLAPGLMLISQNKISTASSILGYGYKNGNHKIYTSLVYKGLYPEIRISSDYGEMPTVVSSSSDWLPPIKSDATNLSIETLLPLNFTTASNIIYFQPSLKYTYNNSYYYNYTNDYFIRGLQMMRYRLYFGAYKFKAKRDIQPKFGFITDMNLINTPFEDELFGSIFYSSSVVFLPGLFKNHGIKLSGKYQEQNPTRYFYNTQLDFPRGFENSFTEKLFISKIDYVLPIIYPDLSLWPVLYLKRIKADLFFDYAQNQFRYKQGNTGNILWAKDNLYSIGCEITADYHFLKIQFPFETGIRYSFLPETNTSKIEAIFSINLY